MKNNFLKIIVLLIVILILIFVFNKKEHTPTQVTTNNSEMATRFPINELPVDCNKTLISFITPVGYEKVMEDSTQCGFEKSYGSDIKANFDITEIDNPSENTLYKFNLVSDERESRYKDLEKYTNKNGLTFYRYGGGDVNYNQENYVYPIQGSRSIKITINTETKFETSEKFQENEKQFMDDRTLLLDSIMIN